MKSLVGRERILKRIAISQSRLISIVAPAGFGKTTLAEAIAAEAGSLFRCDAAAKGTVLELAIAVVSALTLQAAEPQATLCDDLIERLTAATSPEHLVGIVLEAWEAQDAKSVWVFDNLESIEDQPESLDLLGRLVRTSRHRTLILCSRPPLQMLNTRLIPPNEHLQLRHEELAFTSDEILLLFENSVDSVQLERIVALTQGWPVAVLLLLRFNLLGQLDQALEGSDEVCDVMRDYLENEVVGSLSDELYELLLALVATRSGSKDGVFRASGGKASPESLQELSRRLPLVRLSSGGRYSVHPLLMSYLEAARGPRIDFYRLAAARSYERDRILEEAAPLYLDAQREDAAANCLEHLAGSILEANGFVRSLVGQLSAQVLRRYPKLWSLSVLSRLDSMKPELLLGEGRQLRESLRRRPQSLAAKQVDAMLVVLASHIGDHDYAGTVLADRIVDENAPVQGDAVMLFAVTVRDALMGRMRGITERLRRLSPHVHDGLLRAYLILRVETIAAAMGGRFEEAFLGQQRGLQRAGSAGSAQALRWLAPQQAVFAWLAGDEEGVGNCLDDIRRIGLAGSEFHAAIADAWDTGSLIRLRAELLPRPRAYMLLLIAGKTRVLHDRMALLDEALEVAGQADDLWAKVLTLVARSLAAADGAADLESALTISVEIGSQALTESIASLQVRGTGGPALAGLARRFIPSSLRPNHTTPRVRVNALSCSVWRGDQRIVMSKRALALMLTLAVLKHARSVVLLELLWGEDAIDSGTQALKMLVSRARAQLGDPGIIVASRGGYALRDDVIVDFEETERLLRSLSMRQALTDSQRQELVLGYEQFKDSWSRMPSAVNPSVEAAIATTRHRVIERLGKDALERGEVGFVHDLANELRHYDQSDEAAYELEVSAFLQAGNYASAIREYRRYSEHLMQHLGVKPAISMEELMRRNEAHEKTLKRVAES